MRYANGCIIYPHTCTWPRRPRPSRTPEQERAHQRRNKEWRERNPGMRARLAQRWRRQHPKAVAAHNAVARAVKRGQLTKPDTCERCPRRGRLEAHHADYDKPLDVNWLCRRCHQQVDANELRLMA